MALHKHEYRNDRLVEVVSAATLLGQKPIATAMTWPLAQIKRTARYNLETYEDARQATLERFTVYEVDADGKDVLDGEGKRKPAPVYAFNEDGSPKFKTDRDGNVTNEREIKHGSVALTDTLAYERAVRELSRQTTTMELPHLQWVLLEARLKECEANVIEPLMDLFEGAPNLEAEAERVNGKAARRAASREPATAGK